MEFIVFPDHPASAAALAHGPRPGKATQVIKHRSGRPWIAGSWRSEDAVLASVGSRQVALLGCALITPGTLAKRLSTVRSLRDLDALARSIAGSFHLVASIDGEVRVQGTLSTARQVYFATVLGITLAADRPEPLVDRTGAGVDEQRLALELLAPFGPPWPLSERCLWRGVHVPQTGQCLEIGHDGVGRTRRWWTPPEPRVALGAGTVIRDALVDAVAARTAGERVVSADMSGGLDSTTMSFLADRGEARLVTVHYQAIGRSTDDFASATRAAAELPDARHIVVGPGSAPDWYSPLTDGLHDREGPLVFARGCAVTEHLARTVAEQGSRRHLQGIGGDELFHPGTMCLHALARQNPLAALPHVRAMRSRRRWSLASTARVLTFNESYSRWLASCTGSIADPAPWIGQAAWETVPSIPQWITGAAAAAIRDQLRAAVLDDPAPLASLPVQHEMIRVNTINGAAVRRNSCIGSAVGVSFHAPFTDDRVLEAMLSIRFQDRMDPRRFKPALGTAMHGLVPQTVLTRKTKGDASAELYEGLRRSRGWLLDLVENSELARLGLVDKAALRKVIQGLHTDARPLMPFDATLACELWLRSLKTAQTPDLEEVHR